MKKLTHLIPCSQFVLERKDGGLRLSYIVNYASFLQQPLTLGMYVACDETGMPMLPPEQFFKEGEDIYKDSRERYEADYNKALSNVMFEGFEWNPVLKRAESKFLSVDKLIVDKGHHKVEYLSHTTLPLTQAANDKIFGE